MYSSPSFSQWQNLPELKRRVPARILTLTQSTRRTLCPHKDLLCFPFTDIPSSIPPPPPETLATTGLFSISVMLSFQGYSIKGIIQYITFWVWLFSLSLILWRFMQVMCIGSLFCFIAK